MPTWMWVVGALGFLWVVKGAIKKKPVPRGGRIEVAEQLARLEARTRDDDEMAVLDDEIPSTKKKRETNELPGWNYEISVSGASHYQRELECINGRRTSESARKEVTAELNFENDNEFDHQAVRVDIDGMTVGYLSRDEARKWRKFIKREGLNPPIGVPAMIVGGWDRGRDDRGHFGVRLALYSG